MSIRWSAEVSEGKARYFENTKAIFFDKDDTIIDLSYFWFEPMRRLALKLTEELSEEDFRSVYVELLEAAGFLEDGTIIPKGPVASGTNRQIAEAMIKVLNNVKVDQGGKSERARSDFFEFGGPKATLSSDSNVTELSEMIAEYCLRYGRVRGKTDFSKLLTRLKARGFKLGVVTSDDEKPTRFCLKKLEIEELFDAVISANQVQNPKPAVDSALAFSFVSGIACEQMVMVGDTYNDMVFAKNAGMPGIYFQNVLPESLPPGAVAGITDIEDLIEVLGR